MRPGLLVAVGGMAAALVACGLNLPASLDYVQHTPTEPRLGESTTLQFLATDNRGQPQPGVTVHFRLQNPDAAPGVKLTPSEGITESLGTVSVQLQTGGARVTSVVVIAEVGDRQALSPPITFAGGGANGRQFTFQCGAIAGEASGGVHAIGAYDSTRYLIAGVKLECTAHVGDRNGDGVPNAVVSFLTEAGTIGPSQTSQSDVIGNATILYKTSYPLPKEVDPDKFTWTPLNDDRHTGAYIAPLWMHPFDWKKFPVQDWNGPPDPTRNEPRRTDPIRGTLNNPRDNLVTLIAVTSGEEGYTDVNEDGVYEEGEPFDDLTEPFVDSNDNGTWDADERWVDTNGNGQWDGKNGQHDAATLIWVQERILWTGWPHPRDVADTVAPIFKQVSNAPRVEHFQSAAVTLLISDPWFNTLAQNGDTDGCHVVNTAAHPVVSADVTTFGDAGRRPTYPPYMVASVNLMDAHDPGKSSPPDLPWNDSSRNPAYPGGLPFAVGIACAFTASPKDGHVVQITASAISGVVF